jgi:hypothetical protein
MLYETDSYKTIIWDDTASVWREYMSSSSPYDLDGTNSVSSRPIWHYDAAKINGVDTSGNPADAGSLTSQWKSKVGDGYDLAVQTDTNLQPTWHSSGENSMPYVDFDGGDKLVNDKLYPRIYGPFVWFQVMKSDDGLWAGSGGFNHGIFTRRSGDLLYYYTSSALGYNGTGNNSGLTSLSSSTRMLLFEKPNTTNPSFLYVDGDNAQGSTGSGASTYSIPFDGFGSGLAGVNGKVYEMALWAGDGFNATSGPLSTTDKNALIDYVENKYSLLGFTDF